jgi:hypothetical protein
VKLHFSWFLCFEKNPVQENDNYTVVQKHKIEYLFTGQILGEIVEDPIQRIPVEKDVFLDKKTSKLSIFKIFSS